MIKKMNGFVPTAKEVEIKQLISVQRMGNGLLAVNNVLDTFFYDGMNWISLKYWGRETHGTILRRFLRHGIRG